MTTCPKCHHVRATDSTAPAWQCPACGVAYAKAAESLQRPVSERPVVFQLGFRLDQRSNDYDLSWRHA